MKKALLAMFVTLIIALGLFGYFYNDTPSLEVKQAIERD